MLPLLPLLMPLITKAAPSLIEHFTGDEKKDAPLLAKVADVAKDVTGISNLNDAVNALTGNEEVQKQFGLSLMDKQIEFQKLSNADKDSARKHEEALATSDKVPFFKKIFPELFMLLTQCELALIVVFIIAQKPDQAVKDILLVVLGVLLGILKDFAGFQWGSSDGSKKKTDLLSKGK